MRINEHFKRLRIDHINCIYFSVLQLKYFVNLKNFLNIRFISSFFIHLSPHHQLGRPAHKSGVITVSLGENRHFFQGLKSRFFFVKRYKGTKAILANMGTVNRIEFG